MTTSRSRPVAGTRNPGDEAEPGSQQTGETSCPVCHGSGKTPEHHMCMHCGGTGLVVVIVGDA